MSTTDVEYHELENDPELEQPNVPELPPDIRNVLLNNFPPTPKTASGFAGGLVDLMTKADNFNLARLFEAFPVFGVAFMMWDTGLVEFSGDRRTVNWKEEHADKASIMDMPRWLDRCRTLQSVLDYPRTMQNDQTINSMDLAKAVPFGSY